MNCVSTCVTLLSLTGSSHHVTDLLKMQVGGSRSFSRGSHGTYSRFSPSFKKGKRGERKKGARGDKPPRRRHAGAATPFASVAPSGWVAH